MMIFLILIACLLYIALCDECNVNQGSNIIPEPSTTIYCDNTCELCQINCEESGQCMEAIIISSAMETRINCVGIESCQRIKVYMGNIGGMGIDLGFNYTVEQFHHESYTGNIECSGSTSCKYGYFQVQGSFPNNIELIGDGGSNTNENLANANIIVSLEHEQMFTLYCTDKGGNCKNTNFECYGGICVCDDEHSDRCGDLVTGAVQILTPNPTTGTSVIPTAKPTIQPTSSPTVSLSDSPTKNPTNDTIITTSNVMLGELVSSQPKPKVLLPLGSVIGLIISILIASIIIIIIVVSYYRIKLKNTSVDSISHNRGVKRFHESIPSASTQNTFPLDPVIIQIMPEQGVIKTENEEIPHLQATNLNGEGILDDMNGMVKPEFVNEYQNDIKKVPTINVATKRV